MEVMIIAGCGWYKEMVGETIEVDKKPFGGCFIYHPPLTRTKPKLMMISTASVVPVMDQDTWYDQEGWKIYDEQSFSFADNGEEFDSWLDATYQTHYLDELVTKHA